MVDDSYKELFNHEINKKNVTIFIRSGTNVTLHSVAMPWLILNSNVTIK